MKALKVFIFCFALVLLGNAAIAEMSDLAQPVYSDEEVVKWAEQAVQSHMNMGFSTYDEDLEKTYDLYFTERGRVSFQKAFQQARLGETLEYRMHNLSSAINGSPEIILQGRKVIKGTELNPFRQLIATVSFGMVPYQFEPELDPPGETYSWYIAVPLQIVYSSDTEKKEQNLMVKVLVIRSKANESGLGIREWHAVVR